MSKLSRLMTLAIAALVAVALAVPALAQEDETANVRVAHLSPDAPSVDVYLNDEPVPELQGVPYTTVSDYLPVPAGTQSVTVYAAGETSEPVIEADVDLTAGQDYTVGAVGLVGDETLTAQVWEDDNATPEEGNGHLRVVHASPDAGAVDVGPQDGENLVEGLEFPDVAEYAPVPADSYTIEVKGAGTDEAVVSVPDVAVADGTVYSAFATGLAEDDSLEVILTEDNVATGEAGGETEGELPDSGGYPVSLLVGVSLLAAGGLFALRRRSQA